MTDRTVMVDFDDCLVDFTSAFLQKAKILFYNGHKDYIVSNNLSEEISSNWLTIDDIFNYDYRLVFEKFYENQFGFEKSTGHKDCEAFLHACFSDVTFYDKVYFTKEYLKIIDLITNYKKQGYKIILNTKVNSMTMVQSKVDMINHHKLADYFNEIIFDVEFGIGHSEKPTHYDVMIDDSPKNIINYLNQNKKGIILMPLRRWNKYLLEDLTYKSRITII